jgi:transcriptional regulator with XRE-family HTH domain
MVHGGDLIKVARTARGMTQDELALLSGFGRRTLQSWEQKKAEPKYSVVVMICKQICGVDLDQVTKLQEA